MLLHLTGEEALKIHNTFSLLTTEQKLNILFEKFEDYCNPNWNITFERHKFFMHVQEATEGINQYVIELRTKASTCEFRELCDSLIWDKMVCGIVCDTMRKIIAKNKLKSSTSHRYVQSIGVFKTPNKFHQPRIKECELGKIGKPHQVVNSYQRTVRKRSPAEDRQWTLNWIPEHK